MLKNLCAFALALTAVIGLSHFGIALVYDRYLFLFLILSCIFIYSQDKNIFSLFVLLALEQLIEELIWSYSESAFYFKPLLYAWCFFGCYLAKDMTLGKFGFLALVSILISEAFWHFSGNDTPPDLGWSAFILGQVIILHEAAFMRPHVLRKYFPKWESKKSFIADGYVMDICIARIVLELLNIAEYLIRHFFEFNDLLVIYTVYPYVAQALTVILIYVVFEATLKVLKSRLFHA